MSVVSLLFNLSILLHPFGNVRQNRDMILFCFVSISFEIEEAKWLCTVNCYVLYGMKIHCRQISMENCHLPSNRRHKKKFKKDIKIDSSVRQVDHSLEI